MLVINTLLKGRYHHHWVEPAIVGQKRWNVGSSPGLHSVLQRLPFVVCLLLSARPEWKAWYLMPCTPPASCWGLLLLSPFYRWKNSVLGRIKKVLWPVSGKASVFTRVCLGRVPPLNPHTLWVWVKLGLLHTLFWNVRETPLPPLLRPLLLSC